MTRTIDLEPIDPEEALSLYLREKRTDLSAASHKAHEYRLNHVVRWCDQEDIENLNDLTGRNLHRYKLWRRDDGDLNKVGLKTQMDMLRVFSRWCESIDAVVPDLSEKVVSPSLSDGDNQRAVLLETDRARQIFDYLSRFAHTSFAHIPLSLLWMTGMRTGTVHALDLNDYHPAEQRLEARHRPKTDTSLKNQGDGERLIALRSETCHVIDDWIATRRPDVTDDHGPKPLLATTHGRPCKNTIRVTACKWTRPCHLGEECPHGRDPETCEATNDQKNTASKCPSSVSPHGIHRGSITNRPKMILRRSSATA